MKANCWIERALIAVVWLLASVSGYGFWNLGPQEAMTAAAKGNASDFAAKSNLVRCSAKKQETDTLYYGCRYYNASTGRWMSRDPLGDETFLTSYLAKRTESTRTELAKQSLLSPYLFVENVPVGRCDVLGLYNNCCCDSATVGNNKDWLISRYNLAKLYLMPYRPKGELPEVGPWSCLSVSLNIAQFMARIPKCWTCYVEQRWQWWPLGHDLNVIVCESHPKSGKPQKIYFDYWHDAPPAQDYSILISKGYSQAGAVMTSLKEYDCSSPNQDWQWDYTKLSPITDPPK